MSIESILLPKPKSLIEGDGCISLWQGCRVCVPRDATERLRETAQTLARELSAGGIAAEAAECASSVGDVHLTIGQAPANVPEQVAEQGYSLDVSQHGVRLTGWGEPGLYYATRTLLQLLDEDRLPVCRIEDWPDYRHRMVHYDLARENTCNVPYLRSVIDRLSAFKVNMLHLYLENRFQFGKHPLISPPGVMTGEQAKELNGYARSRFVELVPELNCLGHLEQALVVSEYRHLAEDPNVPYAVCPLHPDTPRFLDDLIEEMSASFGSEFFHIGGDEADQIGSCPKCAEWIEQHGRSELFAMHYGRVHEMVKARGKRTMMWGDMLLAHPEAAGMLPKDIVIFDWHYGDTSVDTVRFFTGRGFPVFVCPAMSGFGRTAAPFRHAQSNIWKFIGEGKGGGAIGECACAWELRLGHLFDNDQWGIILSADRAWNVVGCDLPDFNRRFCKVFYGIDNLRPVEYFEAVSDGFAEIQEKLPGFPARSSWKAFSLLEKSLAELGGKVTEKVYRECVALRDKCLDMLNGIRRDATRNREFLAFADLPAHTSMLLVEKLYVAEAARRLVAEGKRDEAEALLRQLLGELDYFKSRFEEAVKASGGSELDLERVGKMRAEVEERLRTL